jgi:hypothetical protein
LDKLPDFTEIDLFKEEIYKTLEDYATRVESMKEEMEELSNSAEVIEEVLLLVFPLSHLPSTGTDSGNDKRLRGPSQSEVPMLSREPVRQTILSLPLWSWLPRGLPRQESGTVSREPERCLLFCPSLLSSDDLPPSLRSPQFSLSKSKSGLCPHEPKTTTSDP